MAERAGVGISALYRRYASKEELLRKLCSDGLARYIEESENLADDREPWVAFGAFLHALVDADTNSLTQRLAERSPRHLTSGRTPPGRLS